MEVPYVSKEVSNVVQLGLVMIVMKMMEGEQVGAYFGQRLMKAQLCFIDQPNFIDQLHKSAEIN